MDQRLEELEGKVTSIDKDSVVDAILGNALTKDGGVVNDIRSLQTKSKTNNRQSYSKQIV
jgi:hypothetical protein